jgi:F-type H+-transporting ATPase subunit b
MAEPVHTTAGIEVPGEEHHEASALGLTAGGWVAVAMLVVFAILIWKKVPGAVAKALDDKIAAIRSQLDEAKALREEAEALKREYEKKAKSADKEAKAMIERAAHEAEAIVAKADADAKALVERRARLAEDKIAAEERAAVNELRAAAAAAAARAAEKLIAERHDAKSDARLVDQAISGLGKN